MRRIEKRAGGTPGSGTTLPGKNQAAAEDSGKALSGREKTVLI